MRHFFRAAYRFGLPFAAAILLIFAIAGLVRVLLDQAGERNAYQQNAPTYAALGTPISATVTALAPVDTGLDRFGGVAVVMGAQVDVAQLFATNTPRGESPAMFATNTPDSAVEPVVTPAPTEPPQAGPTPTFAPLPTILFAPNPPNLQNAPTAIPTAFPVIDRHGQNLFNILLMGQDNEVTGDDLARTDTMIVVSINRDTNTVAMLSLPRDLYVYMPQVGMNRLNVAYGVGSALGWDGGPFFYMRQVILYNLGINVHYFAMVDLTNFAKLIDSIGGVDIAVDCAIQDYQIRGATVPSGAQLTDPEALQYTLPIGYYHMSGQEALWYARSRGNSDDFDRGRRQQAIIRAAFRAVRDQGLLSDIGRLPGLISDGLASVDTDLRVEDVLGLIPTALSLDPDSIETYRLIRTYHTLPWQPPDGQFVQLPQPGPVFDLMTDFYTPPTGNQIALQQASIRVLNATENPDWDKVGAARLGEVTLSALAAGHTDDYDPARTVLIDHVGSERGGAAQQIIRALNLGAGAVIVQPDPNRTVDYEVIVGADFNPCGGAVLDPE